MKKIIVGNDQAKWRKALGKMIKEENKETKKVILKKPKLNKPKFNKKHPFDHPKRMIWHNKESKIPAVVLDECVFSPELQNKVSALGFNVLYLGSGLSDAQIRVYMKDNPNTVIITSDVEFSEWFTWKQCFLIEQKIPEHEVVNLINEFMWIHKENAK